MKFIKLAANPDSQSLIITDDKGNVLFGSKPCNEAQFNFLADSILILLIRLGVLPKLELSDKTYHIGTLLFRAGLTPNDCVEFDICPDDMILSKPNYHDAAGEALDWAKNFYDSFFSGHKEF